MGRLSISGLDLTGTAVRLATVASAGLLLANCSGGTSSKVDAKYGVSASERVVQPGEPVPKGGGAYRVGKPYVVGGRTYVPEANIAYSAEGVASYYSDDFHGRFTANGEIFDMNSISAAHPTLPMPSYVRVTNLKNRRSLIVRVNDRGPYAQDRIIDLSVQSAKLLGIYGQGLGKVRVDYVGRAPLTGSDDHKLMATLRDGDRPAKPQAVRVASAEQVQVASAGQKYVPEFFDSRPMTRLTSDEPTPQRQIYATGEATENATPRASAQRPATVEFAANARGSRASAVERAELEAPARPVAVAASAPPPGRLTSPVSAYAPVRYDAPAAVLSGRGLY